MDGLRVQAAAAGGREFSPAELQAEMAAYWDQRSGDFGALRRAEYQADLAKVWRQRLLSGLPRTEGRARVLDLGTGTGFFAFLLAEAGHEVTALDLSPEMLRRAEVWRSELELAVDFKLGNAADTGLPEGSFDYIVTRNLSWALPDLEAAYAHWFRLLRLGGRLLNFDADYCHEAGRREQAAAPQHKDCSEDLRRRYGDMAEYLGARQGARPDWDLELVPRQGFRVLDLDTDFGRRIYKEGEVFYNPSPLFALLLERPA